MSKKIIIISASVLVLAFIIGFCAYNQCGLKSANAATEKTEKCLPENCKKCPELSKCMGESESKTDSSSCQSKCEGMKACEHKCSDQAKCEHEKSNCCDKKSETKECEKSSACSKECTNK